jgi:glucokinase
MRDLRRLRRLLQDRDTTAADRTDMKVREQLLVGDAGGTKTRLGLWEMPAGPARRRPGRAIRILEPVTFPSAAFESLEAVAREYLRQTGVRPVHGVFGVAGPVVGGRAQITNLPWRIAETRLRTVLRLRSARLLNDLVATAWAVPALGPRDVRTINRGTAEPGGAIGVVAPGTGLGEAFLTWNGHGYRAYPSEGGHADFAPATEVAGALLAFLRSSLPHVSVEQVCSGLGIPHLYAFFKARGIEEPSWLAEELAGAGDPTPVIVEAALDSARRAPAARSALDLFVDILGAEAGNVAVKMLTTGGLYLAGGIPPRIAPRLADGRFMRAFLRKGRLSDLLHRVPVRLVVHPEPALLGCAVAASYNK